MSLGLRNNLKHSVLSLNSFFLLLHHHHDIYGASLALVHCSPLINCVKVPSLIDTIFYIHGYLYSGTRAAMNMTKVWNSRRSKRPVALTGNLDDFWLTVL